MSLPTPPTESEAFLASALPPPASPDPAPSSQDIETPSADTLRAIARQAALWLPGTRPFAAPPNLLAIEPN